mgnify:CR=1 FL=1
MNEEQIKKAREALPVTVGISNRHIHLTIEDFKILFGAEAEETFHKPVKQPGQFACKEKVNLIGPRGPINEVRMLGPYRKQTQVELSLADARKLGVEAPIRDSGKLEGTPGLTIVGPKGTIELKQGVIVAKRHIHFTPAEAEKFHVADGQDVSVVVGKGGPREAVYNKVLCRVRDDFALEMHVDIEEANAACLKNDDKVYVL